MKAAPLEVERLVSDDARRLQTAADSARPLPAGEVEELLADLRRIDAEKSDRRNEP